MRSERSVTLRRIESVTGASTRLDAPSSGIAATIGGVDATAVAVFVGIGAALIGAVAALGGVFFGSRWQARHELEQWRRDKLLQYCSDLLAAAREISGLTMRILPGAEVQVPQEKLDQLYHLRWCILLLSEELSAPLQAYYVAASRFAKEYRKTVAITAGFSFIELAKNFQESEEEFAYAARDLLLGVQPSPAPRWQFWSRSGTSKPKAKAVRRRATASATTESGDTPGDSPSTS